MELNVSFSQMQGPKRCPPYKCPHPDNRWRIGRCDRRAQRDRTTKLTIGPRECGPTTRHVHARPVERSIRARLNEPAHMSD